MGVDLKARGLAQVSINLTDFEQTPIHRVFEMVKREAERYGCAIVGSEIVGLVPKKALEMTADFYLQLENFSPAQVLENRLAAALSGVPLESNGKLAARSEERRVGKECRSRGATDEEKTKKRGECKVRRDEVRWRREQCRVRATQ